MARKAHGTTMFKNGCWQARVSMPDGTRPMVKLLGPNGSLLTDKEADKEEACRLTPIAAETMRAGKHVTSPNVTTCEQWAVKWHAFRESHRGLTTTRDNKAHLDLHVFPFDGFGSRDIKAVTRDDIERVVEDLNRKMHLAPKDPDKISSKYAKNIWGSLSKFFDDACNLVTIRARPGGDNPCKDVRGPEKGDDRAKQYLYPSEFLQFVNCRDVPDKWKRAVILAIYLYPRDGELRSLTVDDIDVSRGHVRIHQSWNRRTRSITSTKSGNVREFTYEADLGPLVQLIIAERKSHSLADLPSERDMSRGLRRWLRKAGVDRPALHRGTNTSRAITFHDLRATGITWCAIRGDDPLRLQYRAGHAQLSTTQIYIRTAVNVRDGFGDVFPSLPMDVLDPERRLQKRLEARKGNVIPPVTGDVSLSYFTDSIGITSGADGTRKR